MLNSLSPSLPSTTIKSFNKIPSSSSSESGSSNGDTLTTEASELELEVEVELDDMKAGKSSLKREDKNLNITWSESGLSRERRSALLAKQGAKRQEGLTIWFTGLSASGKSTLASAVEHYLLEGGRHAYRLDGDNIRFGLNKNLGFSPADRSENIRRIAEVAKLFADSTTISLTSFISPYREDRQLARALHEEAGIPFVEVWVDVDLAVAEARDPKGLYKKARSGEIPSFTGIHASAPYEIPERAEVHVRNDRGDVEAGVRQIVDYLILKGYISE